MEIACFSTKPYDRKSFALVNQTLGSELEAHELVFYEPRIALDTVALADGFPVLCAFINDDLGGECECL